MGKRSGIAGAITFAAKNRYAPGGQVNLTRVADDFRRVNSMYNNMKTWYQKTGAKVSARKMRGIRVTHASPGVIVKRSGGTKKIRPFRMGASNSKSAGFFKKGKRTYTSFDRVGRRGITVCRELGSVQTSSTATCSYVGHAVFEPYTMATDLSRAITKWLSTILSKDLTDFNVIAYGVGETNPNIQFNYRFSPTGVVNNVGITVVPGTTTWNDISLSIRNLVIDITNISPFVPLSTNNMFLQSCQVTVGCQIRTYNMLRAKIQVYVKSALKLQNRTVNLSGNIESDDVDNCPLYGKSYEGTGNYLQWAINGGISADTIAPPAGYDSPPTIRFSADTSTTAGEPPKVSQLYRCSKSGKAHLDPGQVKTSVLNYHKTFTLNRLIRAISKGGYPNPPPALSSCDFGVYRIFAFEKMINSVVTDAVTAIKLAFEHDHKIAVCMTAPKVIVSNTIFTSVVAA